jgi:hypothetical protein
MPADIHAIILYEGENKCKNIFKNPCQPFWLINALDT